MARWAYYWQSINNYRKKISNWTIKVIYNNNIRKRMKKNERKRESVHEESNLSFNNFSPSKNQCIGNDLSFTKSWDDTVKKQVISIVTRIPTASLQNGISFTLSIYIYHALIWQPVNSILWQICQENTNNTACITNINWLLID